MPNLTPWFLAVLAAAQAAQATPQGVSGTARCGPSFGLTCTGSSYGNCCSQYSFCGSTDAYCGSGCQSGWGTCKSDPTPLATTPSLKVSTNGKCAQKTNGRTCLGSAYGNCCSQYGYCGSTTSYCGQGCNPLFGDCANSQPVSSSLIPSSSALSSASASQSASASASASASPSPAAKVSDNARCGSLYGASPVGQTCKGSKYGNCCSQYSYCGSTQDYCGNGCQPEFGDCDTLPSTASSSPSSSSAPASSSSVASSSISSVISSSSEVVSTSVASSSIVSSTASSSVVEPSSSSVASFSLSTAISSSSEIASSSLSSVISSSSEVASSSVEPSSIISSTASATVVEPSSSVASSTIGSPTATPSACGDCGVLKYPLSATGVLEPIIPNSNLEQCTQTCLGNAQCQFFFLYSNNDCYIFTIPYSSVTQFIPSQNAALYERRCFESCLAPSASPSIASSSAAISSTSGPSSSSVSSLSIASSIAASPTPVSSVCTETGTGTCNAAVYPSSPAGGLTSSRALGIPTMSFDECAQLCLDRAQCTFFFHDFNSECFLFQVPLSSITTLSPQTGTRLYERTCFPCGLPRLSASIASSSAVPTSTPEPSPSSVSSLEPVVSSSSATSSSVLSVEPVASSTVASSSAASSSAEPSVSSTSASLSSVPSPTPSLTPPSCGVAKFPTGAGSNLAYRLVNRSSLAACSTLCLQEPQCTYLILSGGTSCFLYNLVYNRDAPQTALSNIKLYERTCLLVS